MKRAKPIVHPLMILTSTLGIVVMFVTDQLALQFVGAFLMVAGLAAPLVRAYWQHSNDDAHQSGQPKLSSRRHQPLEK